MNKNITNLGKSGDAAKKTVLMLAYYFPPYSGIGGVRSSKFSKYLPLNRWMPWVLSVDPRYYGGKVNNVVQIENQETKISRLPYFSFPGNVFLVKMLIPFWVLIFVLIHRRSIDAVYMSGSPYHPFILTSIITGMLSIPTILDFRDSWSLNNGFDGKSSKFYSVRLLIYGVIEKISIRFASSIVFATSVLQEEYEAAFPMFKRKYSTITNGYDPDDFIDIFPKRVYPKKTLILAGKFYAYTPEEVDKVMQCLCNLKDMHFIYRGDEFEIIQTAARRAGVADRVDVSPLQPYSEVLGLIAGADVGLVTTGLKNGLGTKIFDYLALGKPVICLVPPDSVIFRECGNLSGVFFSYAPHTLVGIMELLLKAFALVNKKEMIDLSSFTRIGATKKLADVLDRISS
ncbi:hypothetical protein MTYM_01476 [Methylococcales bacterium]|nr:hypothetical protein MTYM_01476 [Methylococcales bacterium]